MLSVARRKEYTEGGRGVWEHWAGANVDGGLGGCAATVQNAVVGRRGLWQPVLACVAVAAGGCNAAAAALPCMCHVPLHAHVYALCPSRQPVLKPNHPAPPWVCLRPPQLPPHTLVPNQGALQAAYGRYQSCCHRSLCCWASSLGPFASRCWPCCCLACPAAHNNPGGPRPLNHRTHLGPGLLHRLLRLPAVQVRAGMGVAELRGAQWGGRDGGAPKGGGWGAAGHGTRQGKGTAASV